MNVNDSTCSETDVNVYAQHYDRRHSTKMVHHMLCVKLRTNNSYSSSDHLRHFHFADDSRYICSTYYVAVERM